MKASLLERGADVYWAGAVRALLRDEPERSTDPGHRRHAARHDELDDLAGQTPASRPPRHGAQVTFLPEPERRERQYTVISVDDHIVEPPHTFEGRLPAKFADRAPRVVEKDGGTDVWVYDGDELPNVGFNAVVGRPVTSTASSRRASTRCGAARGTSTPASRDMDVNGVYASLSFPSFLPGFAGQRLQLDDQRPRARARHRAGVERLAPRGVGRARTRAGSSRASSRTSSIPRSAPRRSARNAERGFKAVTFSEMPHQLGLPSLHTGHWDPLMRGVRRDRAPSSTCTSARPARRRRPPTTRRPTSSACCSSATRCSPRSTGSTR